MVRSKVLHDFKAIAVLLKEFEKQFEQLYKDLEQEYKEREDGNIQSSRYKP